MTPVPVILSPLLDATADAIERNMNDLEKILRSDADKRDALVVCDDLRRIIDLLIDSAAAMKSTQLQR